MYTMSVTTPTSDEEEIHDLVLMFENTRIPLGSETFQSIMQDLMPSYGREEDKPTHVQEVKLVTPEMKPECEVREDEVILIADDIKEGDDDVFIDENHGLVFDDDLSGDSDSDLYYEVSKRRYRSDPTKPHSHVHWPDDDNEAKEIACSPAPDKIHHARLFMKTIPKPILKHDDEGLHLATGRASHSPLLLTHCIK